MTAAVQAVVRPFLLLVVGALLLLLELSPQQRILVVQGSSSTATTGASFVAVRRPVDAVRRRTTSYTSPWRSSESGRKTNESDNKYHRGRHSRSSSPLFGITEWRDLVRPRKEASIPHASAGA